VRGGLTRWEGPHSSGRVGSGQGWPGEEAEVSTQHAAWVLSAQTREALEWALLTRHIKTTQGPLE
jgi:hypothetical protein